MTVWEAMREMILYSKGNLHDIDHFLKVHAYAKLIGEGEALPSDQLRVLEIAALVHDIACPLCREKYGNTDGKRQEAEGVPLTRRFFAGTDLEPETLERVAFLVGSHHTLSGVKGLDHQILIEADYLVNAAESGYSRENIQNTLEKVFRTGTGKELLRSIYQL